MKSEEELLKVARKEGRKCISLKQKFSDSFIEKCKDTIDWYWITYSQKLSEKFIEKYQNKVNWWGISFSRKLSEKFIEKFQDKVNWEKISYYQKLSEEFVLNNFSKIEMSALKQNKYFDFKNIKNTELKLLLELRGEI